MRRETFLLGGGLTVAASSILSGAGYLLTPQTGPPGVRFGAFSETWFEPAAAVAGAAGGFAILALTVVLASRRRAGVPPGAALPLGGLLVGGFALAALLGIWISFRADPPLPPSWNWIRLPEAVGLVGAAAWAFGTGRNA